MVVDDDTGIVAALTIMLEDAGYDVASTSNGHIVSEVSESIPDLILLDIWMGDVDGRDVCKQLKRQNATKNIPIIMISARADAEISALNACANAFIAKPFEMDELLTMVGKYTQKELTE
ncbi:MAG: response regulator transcription factor [Candidatus Levyibacteriota bacterium]